MVTVMESDAKSVIKIIQIKDTFYYWLIDYVVSTTQLMGSLLKSDLICMKRKALVTPE